MAVLLQATCWSMPPPLAEAPQHGRKATVAQTISAQCVVCIAASYALQNIACLVCVKFAWCDPVPGVLESTVTEHSPFILQSQTELKACPILNPALLSHHRKV